MLAYTRRRGPRTRMGAISAKKPPSTISFDNIGSTASILGLLVSLYALRQSSVGCR